MPNTDSFSLYYPVFCASYPDAEKERVWSQHSEAFRDFWRTRVMSQDAREIPDDVCDTVIRILDRNGRGNRHGAEAVARAMVPQAAWRRLFNRLHSNRELGEIVDRILASPDPAARAKLITQLYERSDAAGLHLIGPSGNTVCAMLAAFSPKENLSIISLKDRERLIARLKPEYLEPFRAMTIGERIADSNRVLIEALRECGVSGDARKVSEYCYFERVSELWRGEFLVRSEGRRRGSAQAELVTVIPEVDETAAPENEEQVRESIQVQALLAQIGEAMGFDIWIPRPDRARVARAWVPKDPQTLLDELPLHFDRSVLKTVELIDVVWLNDRGAVIRAFEVEHTTSIYSGILRMADLVALLPNLNLKMHIVAPAERLDKFMSEIRRPVFSYIVRGGLSRMCTFISYEDMRLIADNPHLRRMSDEIIDDYETAAN